MRHSKFLFTVLLAMLLSIDALAQKKFITYNLDQIIVLANPSETQRPLLNASISQRDTLLSKATSKAEKYAINKVYYESLTQTLDGTQMLKINESKINLKSVDLWTQKRYRTFTNLYPFIEDYNSFLKDILYASEYENAYLKQKHFFDEALLLEALKKVKDKQNIWKHLAQEATYAWSISTSKCSTIEKAQENTFLVYHFLLELIKVPAAAQYNKGLTKTDIHETLKRITHQNSFKSLGEALINCHVDSTLDFDKRLKGLDSVSKNYARKEIYDYLKASFLTNAMALEPLQLTVDYDLRTKALAAGKKAQEILKTKILKEKALATGLEELRAQELVSLVDKKNADLKALKERGNQADDAFSDMFEDSAYDTKKEILKTFGEQLTKLISKKEFGLIFKDRFIKKVKKETNEQLKLINSKYELDKTELEKTHELVYAYFLNVAIIKAYYKYEKALQKQKMSVLRYHFEKNYKSLMDGFDIKVKGSKKSDNRTYQW